MYWGLLVSIVRNWNSNSGNISVLVSKTKHVLSIRDWNINFKNIFLIRLKSKIKDLESENELLRTQRVVVERVANSDQADSALKVTTCRYLFLSD